MNLEYEMKNLSDFEDELIDAMHEECCAPVEPFPRFTVDAEEEELITLTISSERLSELKYGNPSILKNLKDSYTTSEMIDARNEVANNFIKTFKIIVK